MSCPKPEMGNLIIITRAARFLEYLWREANTTYFILKLYLYLPKTIKREKALSGNKKGISRPTVYMFCGSLRFVLTLHCVVTYASEIQLRVISKVHVPAFARRPQVPHHWSEVISCV